MRTAFHVACTHCDAVNRVRGDKPASRAKCGRCHEPLFSGEPAPLSADRFIVHADRTDIPILVDFWAEWCAPCRMMAPAFKTVAREVEPLVRFLKLNVDDSQPLAVRYGVQAVPTMILLHRGQELGRVSGAMDAGSLAAWLRKHL